MGTLLMSGKERRRLEVFARVRDGVLTLSEAADLLGMGYRQARRLRQRYMRDGDEGLVHKLRQRRSNRKTADDLPREKRVLLGSV